PTRRSPDLLLRPSCGARRRGSPPSGTRCAHISLSLGARSEPSAGFEAIEFALEGSLQLVRGAADGLVDVVCVVGDGRRGAPFDAGFHHAALVAGARLLAVLVAEVHLDAGDAAREMAQGVADDLLHVRGELLATFDVVVRIESDLHNFLSERAGCGRPPAI